MAHKNLSQSPLPKFKEVDSWKGVADMEKSTIACRHGNVGTSYDDYETSSKPMEAYHVQGDEWETGAVYPQDMHIDSHSRWTWPTRAVPIRFGR